MVVGCIATYGLRVGLISKARAVAQKERAILAGFFNGSAPIHIGSQQERKIGGYLVLWP
jgi:hypothetical protein